MGIGPWESPVTMFPLVNCSIAGPVLNMFLYPQDICTSSINERINYWTEEDEAESLRRRQLGDSDRQSASKKITPGGQEKGHRPYLAQSPDLFGGGARRAQSASVCQLTNDLLERAGISLSPPPPWRVNEFGRRSNQPMTGRGCAQSALPDWPAFVVPPSLSRLCPRPPHTRWRRPAERRPPLGLAEVDSLSTSPLGSEPREPRGRGPGGDRGTCVARPRARAQPSRPHPAPAPARSSPVRSRSALHLTHCLARHATTRPPKLKPLLQLVLTSTLEMFGLLPPKQLAFKTGTAGPAPGPRSFH